MFSGREGNGSRHRRRLLGGWPPFRAAAREGFSKS